MEHEDKHPREEPKKTEIRSSRGVRILEKGTERRAGRRMVSAISKGLRVSDGKETEIMVAGRRPRSIWSPRSSISPFLG